MKKGFTIIELLVAIAIIGLLSSVVMASLEKAKDNANRKKVSADFASIELNIEEARSAQGKVTGLIDGSWCSLCAFNNSSPAINQPGAISWNTTRWQYFGYTNPPTDPWGTIYSLEENEFEFGTSDCRNDQIFSAGPDKTFFTSDDIIYNVRKFYCQN